MRSKTAVEYRYSAKKEGKYISYCTLNSTAAAVVGWDDVVVVVVLAIVSSRLLLPAMDGSIRDLKPCTAVAIF